MRDPHVRFCERRGGVIFRAYSTGAITTTDYYRKIAEFIAKGGHCEIIASASNRLPLETFIKKMFDGIELPSPAGVRMRKMMDLKYEVRLLDHGNFPMINIVILDYDDFREVVYGWDFTNGEEGIVFTSKNSKVVRYFEALRMDFRLKSREIAMDIVLGVGANNTDIRNDIGEIGDP